MRRSIPSNNQRYKMARAYIFGSTTVEIKPVGRGVLPALPSDPSRETSIVSPGRREKETRR